MSDRIDHAGEARSILEWFDVRNRPADSAQVHATLALVDAQRDANEQARIANLIALAGPTHPKVCEQVASDAATALTEWHPHNPSDMGGWYELRPDVAAALGIQEVQS